MNKITLNKTEILDLAPFWSVPGVRVLKSNSKGFIISYYDGWKLRGVIETPITISIWGTWEVTRLLNGEIGGRFVVDKKQIALSKIQYLSFITMY